MPAPLTHEDDLRPDGESDLQIKSVAERAVPLSRNIIASAVRPVQEEDPVARPRDAGRYQPP
jgi:hypothetical protein